MRILATMILLLAMSGLAVPQREVEDVPAEMQRAHQALENAKNELQNAGNEWGGHRVKAISHVDAALAEIRQAENWAKQHHELKK
ncbi:MAG: hypothetical protein JO249_01355 [Acidobacteria bacterium]|nr:hypothetical protein [Acidobacteriota bacterium]